MLGFAAAGTAAWLLLLYFPTSRHPSEKALPLQTPHPRASGVQRVRFKLPLPQK
jgi:hypothetical protein